jgi:hypothetical protein
MKRARLRRPMRRAWTLLAIVALAWVPPPAAAATPLEAAVAPGQVVADAAALLLPMATREADRDGTPDAADALLAEIHAFVSDFSQPVIPPEATYAAETLAALAYASEVAARLTGVPDAIGQVSTILHRCDVAEITPPEYATLAQQLGFLSGRLETLGSLAGAAPPGIRAGSFAQSIDETRAWLTGEREVRACKIAEEFIVVQVKVIPLTPDAADALSFALFPAVAWPTAKVAISGRTTNASAPVRLESQALGLDVELGVNASGGFAHEIHLPETTPLGVLTFFLSQGNLTAQRTLNIVRAPARLDVVGPTRGYVNETLAYEVMLTSVIPERTRNATIRVVPGGDVLLQDGHALTSVRTPQVRGELSVRFLFAGDDLVAPAEKALLLSIVPAPAPPGRGIEQDGLDWIALAALGVLVLVVAAGAAWRSWRARRPAPRLVTPAVARAISAAPPPSLVGLVGWIMAWLRGRGHARAGTTVREAAPRMVEHGLGGGVLVRRFEQIRYGPPQDARIDASLVSAWRRRAHRVIDGREDAR